MRKVNLGPVVRLAALFVTLAATGALSGCGNQTGTGLKPACSTGEVACGSGSTAYCADLQTDNANCGSCGTACPAGEACAAGKCNVTCASDQTLCGSGTATYCANLKTDNANCGTCATTCPSGQACTNGTCTVTCGTGLTTCGTGSSAFCANVKTDPANCGSCGNPCATGEVCVDGTCGLSCGPALSECTTGASGPFCTNLQTDNGNCGTCGFTCTAPSTCVGGSCCTLKTWYQDADGDGFGNPAVTVQACSKPTGYVADNTDCDDTNKNVYPGATEICDGIQDDCSSTTWTSDAGLATFVDTTGAVTDYTAKLSAGTAATPATIPLTTAGTLNVCAGTWYAGFTVGANVAIVGIGGRDNVILDGGTKQQLIVSTSNTVAYALSVSGLTLTHGTTTGSGGAVDVTNAGGAKLTDVAITNSTAKNGGGLFASSTLDLERVLVSGNTGTYSAGGLLTQGTVTAAWLQVTDNQAPSASGSVAGYGGGWLLDESDPATVTATNLTVDRNSASAGGGLVVRGSPSTPPTVTITGGDISGNTAENQAGGVWMLRGTVTLNDVTMVGNRADTNTTTLGTFGGAGRVDAGTLNMNGCTVQNNVDEFGIPPGVGGLYVMGTVNVKASHFGYNCIWLLTTHVCVTPSGTLTAADAVCGTSQNAYVFSDPATITCNASTCN